MQRRTLGLLAGTVLAMCSTAFVVTALPADEASAPATGSDPDGAGARPAHRGEARTGGRFSVAPEVRASVRDLRAIDRLYYVSGRGKDLPALYQDMLAKTQNPQLRNYLSMRLARLQSAPANTDAAMATLRRSLDENIARANSTAAKG
jgi:hypothetical protein